MADVLYLAELVVTGAGTGTTTLYYASGNGHVTGPAETPANQFYDARIAQPLNITRNLFSPGKTSGRSQMGYGYMVLNNADGGLDGLIEYGFDGQAITIRRGTVGAAYPSGFPVIFSGTMEQAEAQGDTLVIKVRDKQLDLERPLQPLKYAGDNILPNGLEGVAGDLKDKPKPICLGQVQNVPAICVNTSKLIYQVNDGTVNSIDAVYDSGVALTVTGIPVLRSTVFGTDELRAICWSPLSGGLFVAAGSNGRLVTSPDGIIWTNRVSNLIGTITDVAAGNGRVIAVGSFGDISTTTDGITWTKTTPANIPVGAWGIHYVASLGMWIAAGDAGLLSTSTDNGATWTPRTSGFGTDQIFRPADNGRGMLVIVGTAGKIATSTNGTTWTLRNSTAVAGAGLRAVAYGNGLWIAGGYDTIGGYLTSIDGVTWTAMDNPFDAGNQIRDVAYIGNRWFLVGQAGRVATSLDGLTWTLQAGTTPFGSTYYIHGVASNGAGTVVMVGGNGGGSGDLNVLVMGPTPAYLDTTDLLNDNLAPRAGEVIPYLGGGYFRLGAPPAGQVTADVTEGANAAARTTGQLFAKVLQRAGKVAGDWSASDVTALDAALPAVTGFWTADPTTFADTLDLLAATAGGWWGVDATGVYRIKQLLAPSGTPVLSLTANDLLRPLALKAVTDDSRGLPAWRSILRYSQNYTVQSGAAVAGVVTDDRRNFLSLQWREARSEMASVTALHRLAPEVVEETLLLNANDATTEVARRQVMRSILRHRYELVLQLNDETKALDLGDVVSLTHPRYGLSAGALFRIIGIEPDAMARTLTLQVWGPGDPTSLTSLPRFSVAGVGTVRAALVGVGSVALRLPAVTGVGNTPKGLVALRQPALSGTGTVV